MGIDALGVPAPSVAEEWFYRVREVPARSKDMVFALFHVRPLPSFFR